MFYILIAALLAGLITNYVLLNRINYDKAYMALIPLTNGYFLGYLSQEDPERRKKTANAYGIIFAIMLILLVLCGFYLAVLITMSALNGTVANLPLILLLFSTLIFSFYIVLLYFSFTAYRSFTSPGQAALFAFLPFVINLLVDAINLPFASVINSLAHIAIPLAFLYYSKQKAQ